MLLSRRRFEDKPPQIQVSCLHTIHTILNLVEFGGADVTQQAHMFKQAISRQQSRQILFALCNQQPN